ncbi:hypothetical protein E2C01_007571 [Portunus trituberculatus]|uniref:Uncharacterized protein n=1 Tax=Portunus trituberculatus TaxID=210409 RepID=A0A5B7D2S1_PORTR|nr:hypothetical protein [Portunus trituberculatus]
MYTGVKASTYYTDSKRWASTLRCPPLGQASGQQRTEEDLEAPLPHFLEGCGVRCSGPRVGPLSSAEKLKHTKQ